MHIEKAPWAPEHHGQKLTLAWAAGEGYEVKDERNYAGDVEALLGDGSYRTPDQIRLPKVPKSPGDQVGIGCGRDKIKEVLKDMGTLRVRTGAELGKTGNSAKGEFYGLRMPV